MSPPVRLALLLTAPVLTAAAGLSAPRAAAPKQPKTRAVAPAPILNPEKPAPPIWATLQSLDAESGQAAAEAGAKPLTFRLGPRTRLWRFGASGATPQDFKPGDRVLLALDRGGVRPEVLSISDEITEAYRGRRPYRVVSQNRDDYQFTIEEAEPRSGAAAQRLTLEYGRRTFLVLRQEPVYVFKVTEGQRLWVNTTRQGEVRMAREVLDDESRTRFAEQQRLRILARAEVQGAPGLVRRNDRLGTHVEVFPDYAPWLAQIRPGDALNISRASAGGAPPVKMPAPPPPQHSTLNTQHYRAQPSPAGNLLRLNRPIPGAYPGDSVTVAPVRERVSYQRDIKALLDVNCLFCHRDGNAQSGYSISTFERMQAGSRRGPGIVSGKSAESLLYLTCSGDRNPRMPPDRDFTPEQLTLLKRWIDEGAQTEEQPRP
jgi:hypothetical protein